MKSRKAAERVYYVPLSALKASDFISRGLYKKQPQLEKPWLLPSVPASRAGGMIQRAQRASTGGIPEPRDGSGCPSTLLGRTGVQRA